MPAPPLEVTISAVCSMVSGGPCGCRDAAARAVDGGARLTESTGDPAAGAPRRSRDNRNFTFQILFHFGCSYFKLKYGSIA